MESGLVVRASLEEGRRRLWGVGVRWPASCEERGPASVLEQPRSPEALINCSLTG